MEHDYLVRVGNDSDEFFEEVELIARDYDEAYEMANDIIDEQHYEGCYIIDIQQVT